METGRTRWTDERIDDLALVVREEIRDLRTEMREGFREVRGDAGMKRRLLMSMWLTTLLGFAALIVEAGLR
jgi:hypothetical protein